MIRALFLIFVLLSSALFVPGANYTPVFSVSGHGPIDNIGKASDVDVTARMDALRIYLSQDLTARGYIINYGTKSEIKKRVRQLKKAFSFLKIDTSRVTVINGGNRDNGIETLVWGVPAGAENPKP